MAESRPDPGAQTIDQAAPIRAISGSRSLVLIPDGPFLTVRTKTGELLDPKAAEVIMALGGKEPEWLRLVEALQVVNSFYPGSSSALLRAADAVGRNRTERVRLAKESSDRDVLLAFAAIGQTQVVSNPNLDPEEWSLLINHRDPEVRAKAWSLAQVLPPSLADYPDERTRLRVAQNRDCPPAVLTRLARDDDQKVLMAVGANPGTPPKTLSRLARMRRHPFIRRSVAVNPSAPRRTLVRLVRDNQPPVRLAAVSNPSLPSKYARGRVGDTNGSVRYAVAKRTDLSPHALSWLERFARHDNPQQYALTRRQLAVNPACPQFLRERLQRIDKELRIASQHHKLLSRRRRFVMIVALPVAVVGLLISIGVISAGAVNVAQSRLSLGTYQLVGGLVFTGLFVAYLVGFRRRSRSPGVYWRPPLPVQVARGVLILGLVGGAVALRSPGLLALPLVIVGLRSATITRQKRSAAQRRARS
jgi:hypothetical protein